MLVVLASAAERLPLELGKAEGCVVHTYSVLLQAICGEVRTGSGMRSHLASVSCDFFLFSFFLFFSCHCRRHNTTPIHPRASYDGTSSAMSSNTAVERRPERGRCMIAAKNLGLGDLVSAPHQQ